MNKKHNGTAIITALFIMTIVAIAATAMSMRLSVDIHRSELSLTAQRMSALATGVTAWAEQKLFAAQKQKTDGLPLSFAPQKYGDALVAGALLDLQARFNINNLRPRNKPKEDVSIQKAFAHLLVITNQGKVSEQLAKRLTSNVVAWLSPGSKSLDPSYLKHPLPYRPAHHLMVSPSELRLVTGFSTEIMQAVLPYLAALPKTNTHINLNTASAEVLSTLGVGLSLSQAKSVIATRQAQGGFKSMSDFTDSPIGKQLQLPSNQLTLKSEFFLSRADVKQGRQHLRVFTAMQRMAKPERIKILWQSLGSF